MGMTIQELETAVRYGLNVIVVVFNDSYWGMYKPFGDMLDNSNLGIRLSTVDFAAIAKGFGCYAEDVSTLKDIPAAVQRAMDSGRPSVLNIGVDYTPAPHGLPVAQHHPGGFSVSSGAGEQAEGSCVRKMSTKKGCGLSW